MKERGIIMNETLNTILTRRSTRKFAAKGISREDMELIVQAGLHAPSGMGRQTWQFTVVQNQEMIRRLAGAVEAVLDRPGYDMYKPQALIIPSNEENSPWGRDDNACAMENIFLAAHSLGIGSVWINQLCGICHEPKIREILTELGIPGDHVVYGLAALGYAEDEKAPKARTGKVVYVE